MLKIYLYVLNYNYVITLLFHLESTDQQVNQECKNPWAIYIKYKACWRIYMGISLGFLWRVRGKNTLHNMFMAQARWEFDPPKMPAHLLLSTTPIMSHRVIPNRVWGRKKIKSEKSFSFANMSILRNVVVVKLTRTFISLQR